MSTVPLSVLDLVPVVSGSEAGAALRNAADLARSADAFEIGRAHV